LVERVPTITEQKSNRPLKRGSKQWRATMLEREDEPLKSKGMNLLQHDRYFYVL
jgi:hypothetical protein